MARESYSNAKTLSDPAVPDTTLTAGINAVTTSIPLASLANLPAAAPFRILLGDELILITVRAIPATGTRGIEGTTAASHASGAEVFHVVTVAGLLAAAVGDSLDTQLLFNDGGLVSGSANLTWDGVTLSVASIGSDDGGMCAAVRGHISSQFPTAFIAKASANGLSIDSLYGYYVAPFELEGGSIDSLWAMEVDDQPAVTRVSYGVIVGKISGGTEGNYSFWAEDLAGATANPYYFWADSRGVYRIREDTVADGSGNPQAVPAIYNPRFTKYTPGAADYERLVQQWVGNVAHVTTEKGGTGTLRGVTLGASASVPVSVHGVTPIVQPVLATGAGHTVDDVITALQNFGIVRQG